MDCLSLVFLIDKKKTSFICPRLFSLPLASFSVFVVLFLISRVRKSQRPTSRSSSFRGVLVVVGKWRRKEAIIHSREDRWRVEQCYYSSHFLSSGVPSSFFSSFSFFHSSSSCLQPNSSTHPSLIQAERPDSSFLLPRSSSLLLSSPRTIYRANNNSSWTDEGNLAFACACLKRSLVSLSLSFCPVSRLTVGLPKIE